MPDWTKSMQQSFEYYTVDPNTWQDIKLIDAVKTSSVGRNSEAETLGSASLTITESIGECYIRIYLITIQNGVKEKHPLGTFLVQTPSTEFDGRIRNISMDAYTPLLELKEKQPPIGYYVPKSSGYKKVKPIRKYSETGTEIDISGERKAVDDATTTTGLPVYTYNDVYYYKKADTCYVAEYLETDYTILETAKDFMILSGEIQEGIKTMTGEPVYFGKNDKNEDTYYCKVEDFMNVAYRLMRENLRAPVIKPEYSGAPLSYDYIADTSDTWLTFISSLIANGNYTLSLDEMGRVLFAPVQDLKSLQPVWTYDDGNSSILYPELTMDHDLYGIPNVVEVVYFNSETNQNIIKVAENNDPNSPISTISRGRRIIYRETNPSLPGIPTEDMIQQHAVDLLRALSSIEYTVTYTHGYCPVRVGDCVRLNYERAGFTDIKAKVISQTIKCEPGCPVTEKAVFTTKLWG